MTESEKEARLAEIRGELKRLLVEQLSLEDVKPEEIADDGELFGEGLGLDSLDAVEIVVLLQRNFKVEVKDMDQSREVFRSVNTLAEYIYAKTSV
ncbi:MAG: phosphopantetheine-binding protein [Kiritimatiellia bacterium]|nr:phosphopantetheine-binding protein [Kiritimatiellia bacterium]